MQTKEAVATVLASGLSKYALAKSLGCAGTVSVNQWLANTKMSDKFTDKFKALYGIEIDDSIPSSD